MVAGLARGWPKDKPPTLDDETDRALVVLLTKVSPGARAQLVALAGRWGSKAIEAKAGEIAATFLTSAGDDKLAEPARIDAAKRLVDFRPNDPAMVEALLAMITPKTSQVLAIGLIDAAGQSLSPAVGPTLVKKFATLTPIVRNAAVLNLLSRAEWTSAFLDGVEKGDVSLKQLTLPQTQALSVHPDASIASRAKALIARGGGLPDADRQKVIDQVALIALKGGDPAKGKLAFTQQCAKCHTYGGEGGKVGPDLTGMGTHPREELLIHILDPSRSVEGNFVSYTLGTNDGRVITGLLASESKTAVELIDAEGKSFRVLREDIDDFTGVEAVAHARRVREAARQRRDGRRPGVPDQAREVHPGRPQGGGHHHHHPRDVLLPRVADRPPGLPRLDAQDGRQRPLRADRPARGDRPQRDHAQRPGSVTSRRRCPGPSPCPATAPSAPSTSSAGSAAGGRLMRVPSTRPR